MEINRKVLYREGPGQGWPGECRARARRKSQVGSIENASAITLGVNNLESTRLLSSEPTCSEICIIVGRVHFASATTTPDPGPGWYYAGDLSPPLLVHD